MQITVNYCKTYWVIITTDYKVGNVVNRPLNILFLPCTRRNKTENCFYNISYNLQKV